MLYDYYSPINHALVVLREVYRIFFDVKKSCLLSAFSNESEEIEFYQKKHKTFGYTYGDILCRCADYIDMAACTGTIPKIRFLMQLYIVTLKN